MEKVGSPNLNDPERREVDPERDNIQINASTETHKKTVKEKMFETPMGGSTRESVNTNTNNKSRSTKIPELKVATQQRRDNLVATSEKSEGEECSNRSTAFASQNVIEGRYQTKNEAGITRPGKLKAVFCSRITIRMKNLIMTYFLKG